MSAACCCYGSAYGSEEHRVLRPGCPVHGSPVSGPDEEWSEARAVQDWDNAMGRAAMRRAEQGTAGERAGAAYSEPAGRPRQRGVRRVRRDTSMDAAVVERVEQLAGQQHGGNYSAALQAVVEAGLATMDAAARMRAAEVELDQLTAPEPVPPYNPDEWTGPALNLGHSGT